MESESNGKVKSNRVEHPGDSMGARPLDKWMDFVTAFIVWGVVEYVVVKVVPAAARIYDQFGQTLPVLTRGIIGLDGFPSLFPASVMLAGLVAFQIWRIGFPSPLRQSQEGVPWDSRAMQIITLLGALAFLLLAVGLWLPVEPGIGVQINNK